MRLAVSPGLVGFAAVALVVTAVSSALAFAPERAGTLAFWALAVGPMVVLAVVAAIWAHHQTLLREWLVPGWGDFTRGLFGAVLLYGAAFAFSRIVAPVGSPREIWLVRLYAQIGDPRLLARRGPLVAAAVVVAAFSEELVWRGAVTQAIADRFGSRTAWVWSAVLYALAYVPAAFVLGRPGHPDPVLVLAALGGGLLWGGMTRAFGRLAPAVLAHALFDWAILMMFPLWGAVLR